MSERKVLNKYFPPDFDPSKIPRRKQAPDRQQVVRLMAPFSMRCNTCGEYIYKGKKFNARKETALGEDYFGIKIFRFYIKCTQCSAEITFKTDPQNTDYVAEHGASRNFEPWRDAAAVEAANAQDPLERLLRQEAEAEGLEDELDPMKALEARTLDSRREMEILDALQDIRTRNARNEKVDAEELLERMKKRDEEAARLADLEDVERKRAEEEDEQLVRRYFSKALDAQEAAAAVAAAGGSKGKGRAIEGPDDDDDEGEEMPAPKAVTIKRVRPADEDDDKEPDLVSLLSESARAAVGSTTSAIGGARPAAPSVIASASTSAAPPPAKRKKGMSAFGVVKRKQKA